MRKSRQAVKVKACLHIATGMQTSMQTGLQTTVLTAFTGIQTGITTDRRYVYTQRLVCKPVFIPVCKSSRQRTVDVFGHAHYAAVN